MEKGILYCVSTGPGDPELMTIKALKALRQCPVIGVTVSKAGEESLETCAAYQTALQAFPEIRSKEILYLILPMTRDPKVLQECHQRAAEQLADCLEQGKSVAYLTLGDVSIYASCMYPAAMVQEKGYSIEMISGVPSFCAAAAAMGRSLASGSKQLHIIPSSYDMEGALDYPGVKVLMKSGRQIGRLCQELKDRGAQAWGVQRCTMEGQQLYHNLEEIDQNAGYYTIVVTEGQGGK